MKQIIAILTVLALLAPAAAFADSTVTTGASAGASVTPAGTTVVPTGDTQEFDIGVDSGYTLSDVSVDGVSQGAVGAVDFTGTAGDTVDHTIVASAQIVAPTGGTAPWCSGPSAPGWNVGEVGGGCGGTDTFVLPGQTEMIDGLPFDCPTAFVGGCMVPMQ